MAGHVMLSSSNGAPTIPMPSPSHQGVENSVPVLSASGAVVSSAPTLPTTKLAETAVDEKPSRKTKGFTLCVGCAPDGENAIRLELVWKKYVDLMAAEIKKDYYSIPYTERVDRMASVVPVILESEKFGTKWVTTARPETASDYARFVEVIRSFAGTVLSAR